MAEITYQRGGYVIEPPEAKDLPGSKAEPLRPGTMYTMRDPPLTSAELYAACAKAIEKGQRFEKKCPLCTFVSERIGSAPTFCVACDSQFELKKDKPVHCAICNLQAPYVVGPLPFEFQKKGLVPDTDGWSRSFFPWPDRLSREQGQTLEPESTWLCPKDAVEVAKFIAHRREPMRTEYENL